MWGRARIGGYPCSDPGHLRPAAASSMSLGSAPRRLCILSPYARVASRYSFVSKLSPRRDCEQPGLAQRPRPLRSRGSIFLPRSQRIERLPLHRCNRKGRSGGGVHPTIQGAPARTTQPVKGAAPVGHEKFHVHFGRRLFDWAPSLMLPKKPRHARTSTPAVVLKRGPTSNSKYATTTLMFSLAGPRYSGCQLEFVTVR